MYQEQHCRLSVNINKIATLRNSRGGDNPNLLKVALDCERFGAQGITVHPRPDERHIKYADVYELKQHLITEFNIEGNPKEDKFVQLVIDNKPEQVTLVPDATNQLTSNHGWDTIKEKKFLENMIQVFKNEGIRVSIFVDPVEAIIKGAKDCGTDSVELYTESYAKNYAIDRSAAIKNYLLAAEVAAKENLRLNAGHDLDLNNLAFFASSIPNLSEVSIGHALISDALYLGLQNTIPLYLRCLQ
ncbi:MAG TPA: pyridoxine 5'-phosphate synthase [Edaphocola sp.]|nr:pyridoxine 5'-phosphate synthase [Edaphocola sp.]